MTAPSARGAPAPAPTGSRLLPPRRRKALLTVHIIATVSALGVDLVLLALGVSSLRGADPRHVYPAASLVASWVLAPLVLVALGSGVALGLLTRWGLLRHWWVAAKLAVTAVLTAVVLGVLVPRLAERADTAAAVPAEPLTIAERVPLTVAPAVGVTLLTLAVVLARYKPGGRVRRRARGPAHLTR